MCAVQYFSLMTTRDLIRYRLAHQQISQHQFKSPGEVVSWMGAVQAQDYLNSLWAIGLRLENSSETEIEKCIAKKSIVRSWPMRGTLHFVTPEDVRWMLKLLAPRVISRSAGRHKQMGLTKSIFLKSARLFEKALQESKCLTRSEMYSILEKGKISIAELRGIHILVQLAQEGLICCGPRKGKQPTFVLLDDWLPAVKEIKKDEALANLTLRYFTSHGPATIQDFVWWSGLTTSEAKTGLEMVKSRLTQAIVQSQVYWFVPSRITTKTISKTPVLLPNYDEYVVGYKDRSHLQAEFFNEEFSRNNMVFSNTIVSNGQLVGQWKRTLKKEVVLMDYKLFLPQVKISTASLAKAGKNYGRFLQLPIE
jgi:hypothetical protein